MDTNTINLKSINFSIINYDWKKVALNQNFIRISDKIQNIPKNINDIIPLTKENLIKKIMGNFKKYI